MSRGEEVRPLANSAPTRSTLEAVLDTAARAPSLKNLQPWRWHVDNAGVHLAADWSRRGGDTLADRRDVLLGCGAVLDHCVVALAASGWHPRVHRFPDPDNDDLALLEVIARPPRDALVELAEAIGRRRSDRRPYTRRTLPAGTVEMLYIRAARRGVALGVVPRSRWARLDDGAVTIRYPEAQPPGSADDAVLLVLATTRDDDAARLVAGETLSHVLLSAASMGLASCPLTEPLNDLRTRLALACEVFDGEAHPQVLVRLGAPATDDDPPRLVERRSVSETTTWGSVGSPSPE